MTQYSSWQDAVTNSFRDLWASVIGFLPEILAALVVLIIGLIVATALGKLVRKLVELSRVDRAIDRTGVRRRAEEAGIKLSIATLLGWIVKWFLVVVVLIAVADILQWEQVTSFLTQVALYLPNVIVAVIILGVGLVIGQFVHDVVVRAVTASRLPNTSSGTLGALAKWAIIVFALLAALIQLGVAQRLIEILFAGIVAMMAIAGGLAFGLGGREQAQKWLARLEGEIRGENHQQ